MRSTCRRRLRDIPPAREASRGTRGRAGAADPVAAHAAGRSGRGAAVGRGHGALAPVTQQNFDGVGQGFVGPAGSYFVNSAPPDTNLAVGPNHIVEVVNTALAVFNKSGTPLLGPVGINTLWAGFGGNCQNQNDGDPVVNYDRIANRWVISQFQVSVTPFQQCVAVSQTGDPTGAYYRYAWSYSDGFPDYPKVGVWPDGYYITFNMFNNSGTAFLYSKVCAYDRVADADRRRGHPAVRQHQQCLRRPAAR